MSKITGQRVKETEGKLYLARDHGGQPEHAVIEAGRADGLERLVWKPHGVGGIMQPLIDFEAE